MVAKSDAVRNAPFRRGVQARAVAVICGRSVRRGRDHHSFILRAAGVTIGSASVHADGGGESIQPHGPNVLPFRYPWQQCPSEVCNGPCVAAELLLP